MASSSDSRIRVAVLGPVLIEDRACALGEPSGALGKSLVVALVLARGFSLTVHNLVDDLWNDAPPRQERAALQTLVSRLRTTTADGILESTPAGYALAIDAAHTDLGLASAHRDRARLAARDGDHRAAEREAALGLELWRGEPGDDLGDTPLAAELATRANSVRDELLRLRAASRLELGDATGALSDLEPLTAAAPLDEELHLLLVQATAASGRRNEAIRLFAEFRGRLAEQLGTRPGPDIVRFHASLLRDEPPHEITRSARLKLGLRTSPNALRGRDDDIAALERLVASSRLTTILGAGGIGKTRLANELGNRASERTAVVFVELASVRTGDDVPLALASTLGIREVRAARPGEPGAGVDLRTRILAALAEHDTLLIVDNCEHIVDAAAAWISDILDSTTNVRVLATSRAPLAIGAERVYPLDSLASSVPAASVRSGLHAFEGAPAISAETSDGGRVGPAVELFVERARAARPGVVLPLDVVATLCQRLDGLPLAIELAAARTRSMSVEEIERRLSDRFALLTGGERTAPARHRTLLAVIDWSWNLLGDSERTLLRRLSRFPDGFSAEAAQVIAGGESPVDVIDDLDALVNQSLVSVAEDPATGILRYRMLETVREFGDLALLQAGEAELVRDRMYDWGQNFTHGLLRRMNGREQIGIFNQLTVEQDNLVAVLRAALDDDRPDVVVALFAGLGFYWSMRGAHTEVLSFGTAVMHSTRLYRPDAKSRLSTAASYTMIGGTFMYGDLRTASRAISRLRKIKAAGSLSEPRIDALSELLLVAGRPGDAWALLLTYERSSDPRVGAVASLLAGAFEENAGELDSSIEHATRAYELSREIEDVWSEASAAHSLAQLYSQLARPDEALRWAELARLGFSAIQAAGDLRQLEWIIAVNSILAGNLEPARAILERFANDDEDALGFDFVDLRAIGRSGLGEIALLEGHTDEGLRLYREAVSTFGKRLSAPIPWLNIVAGACIAAHVRANVGNGALVDEFAKQLRVSLLVSQRLRPGFTDKPVLGSAVLGLASWALWRRPGADDPSTEQLERGVELMVLAEQLNSRQDMPSLNRARLETEVRERYGDALVDAAKAKPAPGSRDEATARALTLIREWRL